MGKGERGEGMSLTNYAQEHITERGGIRTPLFETEPTRVTLHNRLNNAATENNRWLEKEAKL